MMKTVQRDYRDKRGSILIMAMIFATIAAIGIGSYIRLAATEMRMANAQFYSNASLNLAEAGIEEALYAINRGAWSDESWSAGPTSQDREKRFENVDLGSGANGEFVVRVLNFGGSNPTVIAEGRVFSSGGRVTSKQIETQLRRRSLFANGITSRDNVRFSGGNVFVASYSSSQPGLGVLDNGSVASVSVEEDAIDIGNGDIWGWVATGGADPKMRNNGTIRGSDTPAGVRVDPNRVSRDFTSSFPEIPHPTEMGMPVVMTGNETILGDPDLLGVTLTYRTSDLNLSGQSILRIVSPIRLIVDNDVSVTGNAAIVVEPGGSAEMYVAGSLAIRGNGMINTPQIPADMLIYGTGGSGQSFSMGGGAQWFAAVYAPNAVVSMNGGGNSGQFRGAIVGQRITMNGNSNFHYDEDLANLSTEGRFAMARWRELYGSDRHSL